MAFNNKQTTNNNEAKMLNTGDPAYSYDEVFPALPSGVNDNFKPKMTSGYEAVPPAIQQYPTQTRGRLIASDVTQVGRAL